MITSSSRLGCSDGVVLESDDVFVAQWCGGIATNIKDIHNIVYLYILYTDSMNHSTSLMDCI